jgi:hypothetical protein
MVLDGEPGWVCLMCCNSDGMYLRQGVWNTTDRMESSFRPLSFNGSLLGIVLVLPVSQLQLLLRMAATLVDVPRRLIQ